MWKVPGRSRQRVPRTLGSKPRPVGTDSQPGAQTCSRCPPLRRASLHVRASVRTFPNGPTMPCLALPCLALRALCGAHCAESSGATEPRLQGKARKCRSALSGSRSQSDHAAVLINVTLHAVDVGQGQTYVSRMSRRHNSTWLSMLKQRHHITSMRTPRRSGASASCGRQAWVCGEFEASVRDGRSMHSAALHAQLAAIKAMIARAVRSRVLINSQPDSAKGSRGTRCTRSPAHTAATCRAAVVTERHWPYSVEGSGAKHQRCRIGRHHNTPNHIVPIHWLCAHMPGVPYRSRRKPMPAGITTTLSTTGYVRHRDA